jgi:putative hydrolase of the HAD superfamily
MSNPIQIILFDVGGVLIELTGVSTLLAWLGNRLTPEELWRMWLSSSVVRAFETGRVGPDTFADQLIADLGLPVSRQEFLTAFTAWPKGVFPGAVEVVHRIAPQYVRATLCNTNVLHWPRLIEEMGLGKLFAYHFASHLMGKLKPDREVFEHVVAALACEPSAILFLDDQPLNVEAAQAIGLQAVCVRDIQEVERVLTEAGVMRAVQAEQQL